MCGSNFGSIGKQVDEAEKSKCTLVADGMASGSSRTFSLFLAHPHRMDAPDAAERLFLSSVKTLGPLLTSSGTIDGLPLMNWALGANA